MWRKFSRTWVKVARKSSRAVTSISLIACCSLFDEPDGEREGRTGQQADLRQGDPFGLPGTPVAFVLADDRLQQDAGVGADQAGERVQVLAAFGVALVMHRDAADHALGPRLP